MDGFDSSLEPKEAALPPDDRGQREVFTRSGSDDTSLDTVFDLLGNQRRRLLLRFFYVNGFDTTTFDEIASYIERWESRMAGRSPSSTEDIELSLVHVHLPKLESADIVEFEPSTATVTYNSSEALERILEAAIDTSAIP